MLNSLFQFLTCLHALRQSAIETDLAITLLTAKTSSHTEKKGKEKSLTFLYMMIRVDSLDLILCSVMESWLIES